MGCASLQIPLSNELKLIINNITIQSGCNIISKNEPHKLFALFFLYVD